MVAHMIKVTEYNGPCHSESHLPYCTPQLVRGAYTLEGICRMAIEKAEGFTTKHSKYFRTLSLWKARTE